MKLKWTTKNVKISVLIFSKVNPRKIKDDQSASLKSSIEKFNLVEIPCVNTDMVIIGGHQRVQALIDSGRQSESIDVRIPNRMLTEEEVKEYVIISNTHAGTFDFDMLTTEFQDVIDSIDFEIYGKRTWEMFQGQQQADNTFEDEFDENAVTDSNINFGDIFCIGKHTLICGDATSEGSYAKLMGADIADLLLTDPPYGVDYTGGTKDALKIKNDGMSKTDLSELLTTFLSTVSTHLSNESAFYIWYSPMHTGTVFNTVNCSEFSIHQTIIWLKNKLVLGRLNYQQIYEPCFYGWKSKGTHNWYGGRKNTTVLEFDRPQVSKLHPTMKPVKLISLLIANSSKEGDIVLDPFGGSGTTMIAAHQMGRICKMMELDPTYVSVIIHRMHELDSSLLITKNGEPYEL